MTTPYRYLTSSVVAVTLAAGCTTVPPERVRPAPRLLPTSRRPPIPRASALTAYAEFWRVTREALTAPRSRDWAAELSKVATAQALETVLGRHELRVTARPHRRRDSPRPARRSGCSVRVSILDCVDLGDSRLVSDSTGKPLDDLANRTARYPYRADVIPTRAGAWIVERTAPALDEPC